MFHYVLLFSFVALIFSHVAQSQNVAWVNPPIAGLEAVYSADQSWQVGSTQTLSWQSSYPTAAIILNQQHLDAIPRQIKIVEDLVGTQFVWVVNIGSLSLTAANTIPFFYLGVNASDSSGDFLYETSHYINITTEAVTTSSSVASSSTTSYSTSTSSTPSSKASTATTQSAVGISASGSNPASSSSTDTNTEKGRDLSTGAAAGIAVACTLVAIGLFAGFGFLYYRNRKLRQQLAQAIAPDQHGGLMESSGWKAELAGSGNRGELNSVTQIAELPEHESRAM